ncbi:hypothetical protein J1N35_010676 [Gossypium stocksii]|uniref:Uncharacterized protein n=1 Tax=Gossypium stocksii TaxID=47602 RepID=A0A9D3W2T3_9ROSI|nr:hypothetical protein J1N35_010676 [Gossypium stocksii]
MKYRFCVSADPVTYNSFDIKGAPSLEAMGQTDDVLPMMSTGEGTSYIADVGRSDDGYDMDPPLEPSADDAEVALFSEPEPIPTKPEYSEGVSDE